MTRINSAINVELLTDEHLLAEHREIKRLPGLYKQRMISGKRFNDIPIDFTLGKGHIYTSAEIVETADILVIIGTSMSVYPAASLYRWARPNAKIYYIDPKPTTNDPRINIIKDNATNGVKKLINIYKADEN